MKKTILILPAIFAFSLSGCSLLNKLLGKSSSGSNSGSQSGQSGSNTDSSGGSGGGTSGSTFDLTPASVLNYSGENVDYNDGTATVSGVNFSYIELGAYGNGIQMRVKNSKSSTIWNAGAFGAGIAKIEIKLNSGKQVYDNTDVWKFDFGTSASVDGGSKTLSTVADTNSYTVTPSSTNFTYFKMTKILESYTFYVDSIKITLA